MDDDKNKKKKTILIIIFVLALLLILIGAFLLFFNKGKRNVNENAPTNNNYLSSIEIVGFAMDKDFDPNIFEYNVKVDVEQILVKCESETELEGCNVLVDLKDKDKYTHKIKLTDKEQKEVVYSIHVEKDTKNTNKDLRITSIKGIPLEWTNKNITVEVEAEYNKDDGIWYSFDNGKTWGTNNAITISDNKTIQIIIKNNKNEVSAAKVIIIDKIDKKIPTATINIKEKGKDKIILEASGVDEDSGIESYSWNSKDYSSSKTYEVTKAGTYTLIVKDKAGNISKSASINIKDSDFSTSEKVSKTFTMTYVSNGASISLKTNSCSTTGNSCQITLPNITRTGATIIGFSTNKDSKTAEYKAGSTVSVNKSMTLYAITKKTIKANFVANGATSIGSTSVTCDAYNNDTKCSIKTPTITKDGGVVVGWSTFSQSESASYKPSSYLEVQNNTTLYAVTYKAYTATFEKNGATTIEFTKQSCKAYNTYKTCPIVTPNFTRTNGTLIGWSTNKNATTKEISWRTVTNLDKNKTYYAISKVTYTASFYKNGATSISKDSDSCSFYNTSNSCKITLPTITKQGGVADGWNTDRTSNKAIYKAGATYTLTSNQTLFAISRQTLAANFYVNGATSIGSSQLICTSYCGRSCTVTAPSITRTGGTVIGWNKDKSATTAQYKTGSKIVLTGHTSFYAISKQTYTATFDVSGLTTYEDKSRACTAYNTGGCNITLPTFNKTGQFNAFWSTAKVSQLALGTSHSSSYFNQAGTSYKLTKNITLYPNTNFNYYNSTRAYLKYRNFSIKKTYTIGKTLFEYESGISDSTINAHIAFLQEAYSKIPKIFVPAKVFVMTKSTYSNYSIAYGLTQTGPKGSYAIIDVQDNNGTISENATIHELAHAWDSNYGFNTGTKLRDQSKFTALYNSKTNAGVLTTDLNKTEFFAASLTNYYWHYVCGISSTCKVDKTTWYGYKSNPSNEKSEAQEVMEVLKTYIK